MDADPATKVLRNAGYQVDALPDGAQALERIRHGAAVSLVITDLHMPRLDGAKLLQELRRSSETAAIPVIVLTGSSE